MGGCQNYGPFLGSPKNEVPCYILRTQRGTIILTSNHMLLVGAEVAILKPDSEGPSI